MLREATIPARDDQAEALSDALLELGALSVGIEDADADSPDETPLFGEPGLEPERLAWRRSRLKALYDPATTDIAAILARAARTLAIASPEIAADDPVENVDWVRRTQAQFPSIHVTPRLWIVPSWETPEDPAALNLRLDPGVAFGTGSHPTTAMCLAWLDAHMPAGARVLDYGCGTGILSLAAKLFGASDAVGIDIDPQAVEAARANARENGISARFGLPDALPRETFPVIVSNILAGALVSLAPSLLARLAPRGTIVLSGILADQAGEVIAAYRATDPALRLAVHERREDWVCIVGTRS